MKFISKVTTNNALDKFKSQCWSIIFVGVMPLRPLTTNLFHGQYTLLALSRLHFSTDFDEIYIKSYYYQYLGKFWKSALVDYLCGSYASKTIENGLISWPIHIVSALMATFLNGFWWNLYQRLLPSIPWTSLKISTGRPFLWELYPLDHWKHTYFMTVRHLFLRRRGTHG